MVNMVIHYKIEMKNADWTCCGIQSGGWNGRMSMRHNKECQMTKDWDKVTCKRCLKSHAPTTKSKGEWQPWQTNPDMIDTEKVQYWRNEVMITAQMPKAKARELVADGKAIVITGQAINAI
jgi:hypothetical protein